MREHVRARPKTAREGRVQVGLRVRIRVKGWGLGLPEVRLALT